MVPIAIQNSSQETYPLETFIDNVYEPLTDKVVQDLSEHAAIVDGKFTYTGTASQAPSLLIGPSQSKGNYLRTCNCISIRMSSSLGKGKQGIDPYLLPSD